MINDWLMMHVSDTKSIVNCLFRVFACVCAFLLFCLLWWWTILLFYFIVLCVVSILIIGCCCCGKHCLWYLREGVLWWYWYLTYFVYLALILCDSILFLFWYVRGMIFDVWYVLLYFIDIQYDIVTIIINDSVHFNCLLSVLEVLTINYCGSDILFH